jgi:hypothetical protein
MEDSMKELIASRPAGLPLEDGKPAPTWLPRGERLAAPADADYKAAYNRGWKAGNSGADFCLDNADGRGEPHAWYDGYHDAAACRPKWHLAHCGAHHNSDGGCGAA